MKFTFRIQLQLGPKAYEEKFVVASFPGEMTWHITLKLLGFLIFFKAHPKIEAGIGWHYKPDLVTIDSLGRPELWIDCGNIEMKKINKIATKIGTTGEFFILRRELKEIERLWKSMKGKVKHRERVHLIAFDFSFVDVLAENLDITNELRCSLLGEDLSLELENRRGVLALSSKVYRQN